MRTTALPAIGCLPLLYGCAAGQSAASSPEPVVVVVGQLPQRTPAKAEASQGKPKHAARERAREAARKAGVLGVLGARDGDLGSLFGADSQGALGGLTGGSIGDAFGAGGLGLRGSGAGPWGVPGAAQGSGVGRGGLGQGIGIGTLELRGGTGTTPGAGAALERRAAYPDTVQISGNGLSLEAVQTVARAHKAEIDECHRIEQERSPARGSITIACTVGAAGDVTQVSVVDSTWPRAELGDCIAHAAGAWKFPVPKGGPLKVFFPFRF